ncbi:MAG: TIGR04211 family SH3 domain-containing protein [Desulfosudaceae bacterium]
MKLFRAIIVIVFMVGSTQLVMAAPSQLEGADETEAAAASKLAREMPIESAYLTDNIDITLRSGPGIDYKILAMLQLGQAIDILARQEQWSKIRLRSGREGWVANRFIDSEVPSRIKYERIKQKYDQLLSDYSSQEESRQPLVEENQSLREKLEARAQSSDDRVSELLEKNRQLRRQVDRRNLWWFLAGAGVLLLGILIGWRSRREKRRPYFK